MENERNQAAAMNDRQVINQTLDVLPPEYTRKVKIYAETLRQIFEQKTQGRISP